jgi:hypothetical protein
MPPKRRCKLRERERTCHIVGQVAIGRVVDTPLDLGLAVMQKRKGRWLYLPYPPYA